MNKQEQIQEREDQALKALFGRASSLPLEPSPFLATRVLAEVKARSREKRKLRFWQALSGSLAVSFAIAFVLLKPAASPDGLEAGINKPHVVMVKVQEASRAQIASAEVELPDDVYFYSETFPGLKERRELKIAWSQETDKPYFPFVVKSDHTGTKLVKVRFRDRSGGVLLENNIQIHFVKAGS